MKKKLLVLLICIIMLSGCVKSSTTITIKKNKVMDFETKFLISKTFNNIELLERINKETITRNGFNIDEITSGKYEGITISKRYNDIDDISNYDDVKPIISNLLNGTLDDSKMFKVKKSFFKNHYTANFLYNIKDLKEINKKDIVEVNTDSLVTLANEMEFEFVVSLPYKVISSNANTTSEDQKTLKWNFDENTNANIKFEFEMLNLIPIYIIVGSSLLIIIVLIIVISKRVNKQNINKSNEVLIHIDYDPSIESELDLHKKNK